MFKFLGFGRSKPTSSPASVMAAESSPNTRQHSDIQRELVRVVLKDCLRQNGIPVAWLGCEVTALSSRARGEELFVRLVVLKWDDRLVMFLPALQKLLVAGLNRFEPSIDHSTYAMSWQFAPDCGCPHVTLPAPAAWAEPAPAAAPAQAPGQPAAAAAKPKFDLPPSMWDRTAGPDTGPAPFAPTVPGHLN
jgi:hypothetical protein